MNETLNLVTSAPATLDGFGTRTVEHLPYRSRAKLVQFRLVAVRADVIDWQAARYSSGHHTALPPGEFDTWVELGLVEAIPGSSTSP